MSQKPWCIFVATSFAPLCRERAQQLAAVLRQTGFECVFGEGFGGSRISESVRECIASSDLVIALIEASNEEHGGPTQWVTQEVACAATLKKRCLLLVEKNVRFSLGLLGDVEFIDFDAANYAEVFSHVLHQLNVMLQNQGLMIGVKEGPAPRVYISEGPSEEDCNDMARAEMKIASSLTQERRYNSALKHAEKATMLDKNCWQAWIKYSGLLLESGRLVEGTKIHRKILKDFKEDKTACAAAKHNLAVTKELEFGLVSLQANVEAQPLYECALKLDPFRVYTRAALICTYLRLEKMGQAHALLEESSRYEGFIPAMRRELDESVDGLTLLRMLPVWTQNLLYPLQRRHSD